MSRKSRENILCFILVVAIIVCAIFLVRGVLHVLKPDYPEVITWEEYVVQPGDTLWTIVPRDNNYDIRNIIEMVKEHNNIGSSINAYDIIELPKW